MDNTEGPGRIVMDEGEQYSAEVSRGKEAARAIEGRCESSRSCGMDDKTAEGGEVGWRGGGGRGEGEGVQELLNG